MWPILKDLKGNMFKYNSFAIEFNVLDAGELFDTADVFLVVGAGQPDLGQDAVPAAALVRRVFADRVRKRRQVALVCAAVKIFTLVISNAQLRSFYGL